MLGIRFDFVTVSCHCSSCRNACYHLLSLPMEPEETLFAVSYAKFFPTFFLFSWFPTLRNVVVVIVNDAFGIYAMAIVGIAL